MRIAIASDSHDNWKNLKQAITVANERECQYFLFAGDFIAPAGLQNFKYFSGQVEMVWGNNEGNQYGFAERMKELPNIQMNGILYEGVLDGTRIFMNHYPKISELAAKSGDYDLCIYGHSHNYKEEILNGTLLLNP